MAKNTPSVLVLLLGVFFAQQLLLVSAGIRRTGIIDSIPEAKAIAKRHVQKVVIKTQHQEAVSQSKVQDTIADTNLQQCTTSLEETVAVFKAVFDKDAKQSVTNEKGNVNFAVKACLVALKSVVKDVSLSLQEAIQTCQDRFEFISDTLNTKATFNEHAKTLLEASAQDTNKFDCINALHTVADEIKTAYTGIQKHQTKRFVRSLIDLVEVIP